jgi:hypothetical protein
MKLKISSEFARAPGPRHISEGKHSGELFRKKHLLPQLEKALESNVLLEVDLDGTAGYGTSFLEESFGGLIREDGYSYKDLKQTMRFKSIEEPALLDEIDEYMQDAEQRRQS